MCGPLKDLSSFILLTANRGRRRIRKTQELYSRGGFIWIREVWRSWNLSRFISVWVKDRDEERRGWGVQGWDGKKKKTALCTGVTGLIPIEIELFGETVEEPELCFLTGDISVWIWKTSVCVDTEDNISLQTALSCSTDTVWSAEWLLQSMALAFRMCTASPNSFPITK